jgi:hypothetical protein
VPVPPAATPEKALALIRQHVGQAVVRVGVTQYPAGLGTEEPSELSPDLFAPCNNIRMGTALFAKVWRIVWKRCGNPCEDDIIAQVSDDAVEARQRGRFEGIAVFSSPDPGGPASIPQKPAARVVRPDAQPPAPQLPEPAAGDRNEASIRIDFSGIGGRGQ